MNDEIGPCLPPGFKRKDSLEMKVAAVLGPELPSSFANSQTDDCYGPSLPPGFSEETKQNIPNIKGKESRASYDDRLIEEDDSDDDYVGPSVEMAAPANAEYDAVSEFISRNNSLLAEKQRVESAKASKSSARDDWMTLLPATGGLSQEIGLMPRAFRTNPAAEQDDSWTQTPEDRKRQASTEVGNKKKAADTSSRSAQDDEVSKKLKKHNEDNRGESLMAMHQKKLKKDKEKKSHKEKQERVPFSRETDLQVNRFDDAQRKSVLKKAALLDTRFSHGSQKYE